MMKLEISEQDNINIISNAVWLDIINIINIKENYVYNKNFKVKFINNNDILDSNKILIDVTIYK